MNTLRPFILLLFITCLASSCATILNSRVQRVHVVTDDKITAVTIDSSLTKQGDKNSFYVSRSRQPLKLNLEVNGVHKSISIKSRNSIAWWLNAYPSPFTLPGFLIDMKNPKRFSYPKRIYLQGKDTSIKVSRFAPVKRGSISWVLSVPYLNFFHVNTTGGRYTSSGFWGIETGFDYYYNSNSYVSAYGGISTDFILPFPAALDIRGKYESGSSVYASLRDNHTIGSFDFGYGLNVSQLKYHVTNNTDSTFIPQTRQSTSLGLSLSTQYRFGDHFRLGLLYQPSLFDLNKTALDYQHFISLELIWKIPIRNYKP